MGLSSSKTKSKSTPYEAAVPYINGALASSQQVFDQQQPRLEQLGNIAQGAFAQIAPNAFSVSPYVNGAQNAASTIFNGAFLGNNPGESTYQQLQQAGDPSADILLGLAGGSSSPGDYSGIGQYNPALSQLSGINRFRNPAISTLAGMTGSVNGAAGALASMVGNQSNPALGSLYGLQNGGQNNALSGLTTLGYGGAAGGAGDDILRSLASGGEGAGDSYLRSIASGGGSNPGDAYAKDVAGGKYLNAQPSSQLYADTIAGKYLDKGNPYLQSQIDATRDDVTKAANRRFAAAGLGTGLSSPLADVLTKNLSSAENALRYQNYDAERTRQNQAAGQSDAAFANERGQMTAATGQLSSNYNSAQERALAAAQGLNSSSQASSASRFAAANALSGGSRQDAQTALSALGTLSGANNQQFNNRLGASTALGSLYGQGQDRSLTAATNLGSIYGQDAARNLTAAQSLAGTYGQDADRRLTAAGQLGSLYNQTGQLGLQAQQARDNSFQADRSAQLAAATQLGQQFNNRNALSLNAAQAADSNRNTNISQILQALGLTGGLSDAQYAGINPALNLLNASAQIPYTGVNALSGNLNTIAGRYGTQSGTSSPSLLQSAGQVAGIASLFSDRRLKSNIKRVGYMDDGTPIYTYRYKMGGPVQMGVMADEVAPEALGPVIEGYSTVNYGVL